MYTHTMKHKLSWPQSLSSHLIQLSSFLPLELEIMGRELDFGSHVVDRPKKNIF